MTDIVERLRARAKWCRNADIAPTVAPEIDEAAARIAQLEAALKPFADVAVNVPFEPDTEIVVWVPANERNGGRWTAHMPAENFIDARKAFEKTK